jgi:DNA polymerase III epsilon subunit-like protein
MKKIFLDTEFTGLHKLTTLISIALVSEDDKEYYAELIDFDEHQITPFLNKEVLSKLIIGEYDFYQDYNPESNTIRVKGNIDLVKQTLTEYLNKFDDVEIWVQTPYAWFLFVDLFGGFGYLPKNVFRYPFDLTTAIKLYGINPMESKKDFLPNYDELLTYGENNALNDARLNREIFKKLLDLKVKPVENEKQSEVKESIQD